MMKKWTLLFAMMALVSMAFAQNQIDFLGIPLNMKLDKFTSALVAKGYTLKTTDNVSKAVFTGDFGEIKDAEIMVYATAKSNIVYYVKVKKRDEDLRDLIQEMGEDFKNRIPKEKRSSFNETEEGVDYYNYCVSYKLRPCKNEKPYASVTFTFRQEDDDMVAIIRYVDLLGKEKAKEELGN